MPTLEDLPSTLRGAMIKIMADWKITDTSLAYEIAAKLIIKEDDQYWKDVNSEAERKYKSRHFKEQNKTIKTVGEKQYLLGFDEGFKLGESTSEIKYPCSVCKKMITMTIGGPDTKAATDYLVKSGWGHGNCVRGK
jgi:hypothetical protein